VTTDVVCRVSAASVSADRVLCKVSDSEVFSGRGHQTIENVPPRD